MIFQNRKKAEAKTPKKSNWLNVRNLLFSNFFKNDFSASFFEQNLVKNVIESIKNQLDRMYSVSPYFVPRCEITRCTFGNDANLIGAALYWKQVFG